MQIQYKLNRVSEEVDRVLGDKSEVTFQDVNELKYCSAVFKESMRLFPPVPAISRFATDELNIDGVKIPANSAIMMSTFVMGRLEKYFKDPLKLRPERFLKMDENSSEKLVIFFIENAYLFWQK